MSHPSNMSNSFSTRNYTMVNPNSGPLPRPMNSYMSHSPQPFPGLGWPGLQHAPPQFPCPVMQPHPSFCLNIHPLGALHGNVGYCPCYNPSMTSMTQPSQTNLSYHQFMEQERVRAECQWQLQQSQKFGSTGSSNLIDENCPPHQPVPSVPRHRSSSRSRKRVRFNVPEEREIVKIELSSDDEEEIDQFSTTFIDNDSTPEENILATSNSEDSSENEIPSSTMIEEPVNKTKTLKKKRKKRGTGRAK